MKKILIYKDKGADPFGISSLIFSLKLENIHRYFQICTIDKDYLYTSDWQKDTQLLIMPGGRDIPYHEALQGKGNQNITEYISQGGNYLGICAGAYYGSTKIEFEKGGELEVLGNRELNFFPGTAKGPAYGLGKFDYQSDRGAQIAALAFSGLKTAAFFNGGCAFEKVPLYPNTTIIAKYADIENDPAAIVECIVGKGKAILSGVHPEYTSLQPFAKKFINPLLYIQLQAVEKERRHLFRSIVSMLL